jgi:glycerol-3-phosphate acyltransferase PlsY
MTAFVIVGLMGYLAGSIPFSYIAGKLGAGIDLREHGSGNLGASNTYRQLGARIALAVLFCDVAKGFVPVYFAPRFAALGVADPMWLMLTAAFFAIIGHMFSVYLRFTGGKGIATSAGAFLALAPWAFVGAFIVFAIAFAATRIVSVGSLSGAVALPIIVYVMGRLGLVSSHGALFGVSLLISVIIIIKHRSNIRRLLSGRETSLGRNR